MLPFSMVQMPRSRQDHSCGLVIDPERGPEIVVAGGFDYPESELDTVDIYTVSTDTWREGNINQMKPGNWTNNS